MGRLDSKIALIAGGGADGPPNAGEKLSIGNGRATAITAAREGAIVMAADLNLALAQQTADAITSEGGKAAAIACDVSREDDCRRAVADTVKQFGGVHLLVNNVGIAAGGSLLNTTTDQFEKVYAVNLRSHFLMMRYAVPEIIKAGGGAIVNTASAAGLVGVEGLSAYNASKHGVVGLTKTAALEFAQKNIRVNCVCPGLINTPMVARMIDSGGMNEQDFIAGEPVGRMGKPEEIGEGVVWLLSDAASFVTGHSMSIDGGWVAQ